MDKLDLEILNRDINTNKYIIDLKQKLKTQNILLTIGLLEDDVYNGENITLIIQDNNKIEDKTTVFPIPDEVLNYNFNNLINFIIDHFT